MVDGESGLRAISPKWERPRYIGSQRRLEWPNGTFALLYSGEEPDQLRGPQHHKAWVDELAKYKYPQETWDNLELGLRLGENPQVVVTTTPRPLPLLRDMLTDDSFVVTSESTYANVANLPQKFIKRILRRYEGTRLGRQELYAHILDDVPGALWSRDLLDETRWAHGETLPRLFKTVVAVDPQGRHRGTGRRKPDLDRKRPETGIVVVGLAHCNCPAAQAGDDVHGFVIEDATRSYSPELWGRKSIDLYRAYRSVHIVAERNFGGDMVESNIRAVDRGARVKTISASKGKYVRAEPVAALYEQRRVHHVGMFATLEDQMCTWTPDDEEKRQSGSPNNMDALVWALTDLFKLNVRSRRVVFGSG